MVTSFVKKQLIVFAILTVAATAVLVGYYLHLPAVFGVGRYTLKADLPSSGGLYRTANVTYRGATIGKVTAVVPTRTGVEATMSIDDRYKIPVDGTANVHSVSAVGEQYLDLVSRGNPGKFLSPGQTITAGTVPAEIGTALEAVERGLAALPKKKIAGLLDETSRAFGGLGPALRRLVDSTQALAGEFEANSSDINAVIENSTLLDSTAVSGDAVRRWVHNLNTVAVQTAQVDPELKTLLTNAAPTLDAANGVVSGVRESLPQTLANLDIIAGLLVRYHKGVEQVLALLPQNASIVQTAAGLNFPGEFSLDLQLAVNSAPPCLTGFLPAPQWRSPADTSIEPLASGLYCKIPQDFQGNAVRGARNLPCVDVDGKRAATPQDCRSDRPYVPLGTNPWYGDPNQIRNCPAPGARCDQPVNPGQVIPAPTIDTGLNPAPADRVAGTPPPISDPLSRPGSGIVQCNGQQPNPCIYTPAPSPLAFTPQAGEATGPDGVRYSVQNSIAGDDGWKTMLAPAG